MLLIFSGFHLILSDCTADDGRCDFRELRIRDDRRFDKADLRRFDQRGLPIQKITDFLIFLIIIVCI